MIDIVILNRHLILDARAFCANRLCQTIERIIVIVSSLYVVGVSHFPYQPGAEVILRNGRERRPGSRHAGEIGVCILWLQAVEIIRITADGVEIIAVPDLDGVATLVVPGVGLDPGPTGPSVPGLVGRTVGV